MTPELGGELPVLVDEDVWPDFQDAVRGLGERWTAPSGRSYVLDLAGRRLEVRLVTEGLAPLPAGEVIDEDLFELACAVLDLVEGDEWSSDNLRQVARVWRTGMPPGSSSS